MVLCPVLLLLKGTGARRMGRGPARGGICLEPALFPDKPCDTRRTSNFCFVIYILEGLDGMNYRACLGSSGGG